MDRKGIAARYFIGEKYETELFKILDKIENSIEKNIFKYTNFVDPYIASICNQILRDNFSYVKFNITGGYRDAERKIVAVYPDYYDEDYSDVPLKLIKIDNFGKRQFNHREILGSILSLGLKRDKIGDIIINKDIIQIVALEEISSFVELSMTKVGKYKVKAYIDDIENIVPKENNFKIITDTVKTLRLDSVCSAGFNESRSKAAMDIKREKIKVNFIPISTPSYNVKEGDLISYRGKGRIILDKLLGETKKERLRISIKKFI